MMVDSRRSMAYVCSCGYLFVSLRAVDNGVDGGREGGIDEMGRRASWVSSADGCSVARVVS